MNFKIFPYIAECKAYQNTKKQQITNFTSDKNVRLIIKPTLSFMLKMSQPTRAEKNREDLLHAAITVFLKHSIHAPLQMIIDHAGVGRATFYRNFADRQSLVFALLDEALRRVTEKTAIYSTYPDGLFQLLYSHCQDLAFLNILLDYWRVIDAQDPRLIQFLAARQQLIQPLIDQAIQHQLCRADLTIQDYSIMVTILASSFQGQNPHEQQQRAKRALHLLLDGIRI